MRRGLTVGFTGAGGTGKTTTATQLAQDSGLDFMKSASRVVYERDDLTEQKVAAMSPEGKWTLQHHIFDHKIAQDDASSNFVADRTLLDHWAYCLMYCAGEIDNGNFEHMENLVRKHMLGSYSHIFYFPWGYWTPEVDGVRSDSMAWQSAIDNLIVGHLMNWNLPVIEVPQTEGPEKRLEFVQHTLAGMQQDAV